MPLIRHDCPKCQESEISEIESKIDKENRRFNVLCECHICGHKFTLVYTLTAYYDHWV